ncbi:MAG TPA: DUF305 domain-containing protein [Kofleriaceae bacterium]|nr:DUF305 domain-containing protein [Kofleriaceae bacterium]
MSRVGYVLCVMLVVGVGCATEDAISDPAATEDVSAAAAPPGSRWETQFLKNLIDDHEMAVRLASLCEDRARHEELAALCSAMANTQAEDIHTLQGYLQDWYGIEHEPMLTELDQRQLARLERASGRTFEILLLTDEIVHHKFAARRAERCQQRAVHEELLAFCAAELEAQVDELQQLIQWLCQWYDRRVAPYMPLEITTS